MYFNLIHTGRHLHSKSYPADPLQAVTYPAALNLFITGDWLL